jgi:hypothetical protein
MKAPADLHQLIRSLSKSEKRYFKIYASQHIKSSDNNCIRLFDAIERQEEYDEGVIRDHFNGERFTRQLPVQKNYLYDLILKSLRAYHSSRSDEMRIKCMLQDVEILYARGLYTQCRDILARARALTTAGELFEHGMIVVSWQIRIAYALHDLPLLRELADAKERLLEDAANLNDYFDISIELYDLDRTGGWLRDRSAGERIERLVNNPLLQEESMARSFRALLVYYNSHDVIAALTGDTQASYENARRYLTLIESKPEWLSDNTRNHIAALSNAASACFRLHRFDEMNDYLKRLEELPVPLPALRARVQTSIYRHTLNRHVAAGEFEEALQHLDAIGAGLGAMNGEVDVAVKGTIRYLMAYVCFGAGRYRSALEIVNEILSTGDPDARLDIQKAARILNLILHFELGNNDILPYVIRSTYRYLQKRDQLHHAERCLLSLLRRLPGVSSRAELPALFQSVLVQLEATSSDPAGHTLLRYIDLSAWLRSKLGAGDFADLVAMRQGALNAVGS